MRIIRLCVLIVACLAGGCFMGYSQVNELENLYKDYQQEKSDSLRIEKHFQIISLLLSEPKNHMEATRELNLLKNELVAFPIYLGSSRLKILEGHLEYLRGEYIKCIISFKQAIQEFELTEKKDVNALGYAYEHLGLAFSMVNDWENAQINYQHSIEWFEKIADSSSIGHTYFNMSYIFADIEDWQNAIITIYKSINYITPASEKELVANIYASLSTFYGKEGKFLEATQYLKLSDSVIKLQSSDISNTLYYIAEGEYFQNKNELERSLVANELALKFARSWGDSAFVANILENMGVLYMKWKNMPKSIYYLMESIYISESKNFLPQKVKSLKRLFHLYKETGQSNEAVKIANQLLNVTDSLARVLNNNRRIIMDASFENERKEKRISALESEREIQILRIRQKNILNYILIAGAALALLILFLSYRNYQQNKELQLQRINELEREKKLTATEAVFKGEEQERTRIAKDLHDGLGGLLSGIKYSLNTMKGNLIMTPENNLALERSMDMLDSSIKEMRRVAHNMMPETLVKFGLDIALKDFCTEINQTGALMISYQSIGLNGATINEITSITIYRIIQELINNTFKHAAAKTAIVQVTNTNGRISITVEDDGIGFDKEILKHSKGIGWVNIQNRVEFLKGDLDVQTAPGKGTSIHIEMNAVT